MLTTNSLALLRATYGEDSGRAVGQWTAWSGIGTMIGPPLGGLLVEYASWRLDLLHQPARRGDRARDGVRGRGPEASPEQLRPLQWPVAAAIALTFGDAHLRADRGRAGRVRVGAVGVRAVDRRPGALVVLERRSANPLLPLELLRARVFVVANIYTLLVYAALGGSTFYLALYLQSGAVGYSPARASLVFLPISLVMFVLAARFGRLADRDGPRRYLMVAPLVMSIGFVLLMFVTDTNPLLPLPGVLVLALGLAMLVAPITATALKAAPDRFAGLAAGVNTTVSRLGGLIATPLLGVVITLVFASTAPHPNVDPFATHLSPDQRDATVTAFRAGVGLAVVLCLAGSLLAARGLRPDDR